MSRTAIWRPLQFPGSPCSSGGSGALDLQLSNGELIEGSAPLQVRVLDARVIRLSREVGRSKVSHVL
jgi:hypothetical protein